MPVILYRLLPAALIVGVLSGCTIVTYEAVPSSGQPADPPLVLRPGESPPALTLRVQYNRWYRRGDVVRAAVEGAYEGEVVVVSGPPAGGLYLEVEFRDRGASDASGLEIISGLTLTLIPAYANHRGLIVAYRLHRDDMLRAERTYEIVQKEYTWLPLILVSWVNLISTDLDEIVAATAQSFVEDAVQVARN